MNLEQINERIERDPESGCWIWTAAEAGGGYGQVMHEGRQWKTHRLIYTLMKGDIPAGMQLDHLCRVRLCCNPDHLEPVTGRENIRRSPIHNGSKLRCKQGHGFTAENTGINRHAGKVRRYCRTCQREWNRVAAAKRRARQTERAA